MSPLHLRLARLAKERPELRPHLAPLLLANSREAGFLDFLKRKPVRPKNKSGLLASITLPGQPEGPLARALNTVRRPLLVSAEVIDWEAKDNGDTLVVDFDAYFDLPNEGVRVDPDYMGPPNYQIEFKKALQPLAREISDLLNAPVVATVEYDPDLNIGDLGFDYRMKTTYRATFKVPRGTSEEMMSSSPLQPSPLRVAARYRRR